MSDPNQNQKPTDRLVRRVIKDDLPPDIEERMASRLGQFRRTLHVTHRTRQWDGSFELGALPFLRWIPAKQVLAFASLLMVSMGGFLHVTGHRSAMAETLSFMHTSLSISDQLLRVTSMECTLHVPAERNHDAEYRILWQSPEAARVDAHRGDADKTLWVKGSDASVVDHTVGTQEHYSSISEIEDPLFDPALEFLTPVVISGSIYGKWTPKQYRQLEDEELLTLVYINYEGKTLLEMTVDLSTDLPVSIRRFSPDDGVSKPRGEQELEARFVWDEPISSQLLMREK